MKKLLSLFLLTSLIGQSVIVTPTETVSNEVTLFKGSPDEVVIPEAVLNKMRAGQVASEIVKNSFPSQAHIGDPNISAFLEAINMLCNKIIVYSSQEFDDTIKAMQTIEFNQYSQLQDDILMTIYAIDGHATRVQQYNSDMYREHLKYIENSSNKMKENLKNLRERAISDQVKFQENETKANRSL